MNHAEKQERDGSGARCKGTTSTGAPCRSPVVRAHGFCHLHSPSADPAAVGRKGGKARKRKQEEPGDRLERLAHAAIGELLLSSANATARASAARLVVDKLSVSSPLSMELARRAASEEMAAQAQAVLPAAKAKLARLIESRAEARARELTVELEKRTVEAEARLAEFTATGRALA